MMEESAIIYIVDDERDVGILLERTLQEAGYRTKSFVYGHDLLHQSRREAPDLCIVDLGLPDIDGLELLKQIRAVSDIPTILLTIRGHPSDRILGLELGADDYIVKPFEPREVMARVKTVLRRSRTALLTHHESATSTARFAGWIFDPGACTLCSPGGERVPLSVAEARLLEAMTRRPNRVLSREYLLGQRGCREHSPYDRSIDLAVSKLRQKIEKDPRNPEIITTVYGAGYVFSASVEWRRS
jgi:Response regulators consisting of a CheY-like receiver domain and a winged-helix DNA-binding domain